MTSIAGPDILRSACRLGAISAGVSYLTSCVVLAVASLMMKDVVVGSPTFLVHPLHFQVFVVPGGVMGLLAGLLLGTAARGGWRYQPSDVFAPTVVSVLVWLWTASLFLASWDWWVPAGGARLAVPFLIQVVGPFSFWRTSKAIARLAVGFLNQHPLAPNAT